MVVGIQYPQKIFSEEHCEIYSCSFTNRGFSLKISLKDLGIYDQFILVDSSYTIWNLNKKFFGWGEPEINEFNKKIYGINNLKHNERQK